MKLELLHTDTILEKEGRHHKKPFGSNKGKEKDKDKIGKVKKSGSAFERTIKATGLDQSELADKVGVDKSTISRYKHGDRVPSYDSLADLVDATGFQASDMFPELQV